MLLLFTEVEGSSTSTRTAGSGLYIAGGVALVVLGYRLLTRPPAPKEDKGPSKTDRYLESARLVLLLGFILYVVPSPIYMGVVKAIADTNASTGQQIVYLVIALLIMLWLIEVPMLVLLIFPERGAEDFRNPAAARWLASVWARGAAVDADTLAKDVAGAPLSLSAVGRRLLSVLGA